MTDKAQRWITNYLSVRKNLKWTDFVLALVARFRDNIGDNAAEKFNKLSQNGNVEVYIDEFENYRSLMNQQGHNPSKEYVLDSFIDGLKDTIKPFVRAFKPTTTFEAIEYDRLQEDTLSSLNLKPHKNYPTTSLLPKPQEKPTLLPLPNNKPTTQSYPSSNYSKTNKNLKYVPTDVRAAKIAQKAYVSIVTNPFKRGINVALRNPNCLLWTLWKIWRMMRS